MWTEACHTMEMECFSDSSLYGRKKSGKYHETPMEWLCVIFGRPQINLVRVRFALEAICYRMNAIVNRRYSIVFGTYLARICSLRSTLVYLSFRYRVVSRCRNKEKKYQKAMRACRAGMITEKKILLTTNIKRSFNRYFDGEFIVLMLSHSVSFDGFVYRFFTHLWWLYDYLAANKSHWSSEMFMSWLYTSATTHGKCRSAFPFNFSSVFILQLTLGVFAFVGSRRL